MFAKINLIWNILLNKKFSDQFGENFCFTKMGICHLSHLVNFFLATFLQVLYLVTQMVFFQNQYMDSTIGSKMTLVNIVPQVVLHLKMHAFLSVGFFGEWTKVPAPCDALAKAVDVSDKR